MNGERRAILGLLMLAGLASLPARAEEAAHTCEVPAWLLTTESPLPKVTEAVKAAQKLEILVVGTRSSTINTAEAMAWPGRLEWGVAPRRRQPYPPHAQPCEIQGRPGRHAGHVAGGL